MNLRRRFQSGADQENLLAYAASVADLRQADLALAAELRDRDRDLVRAGARAGALDRALARGLDLDLTLDLTRDITRTVARDLALARGLDLDLARAVTRTFPRVRDRDLDLDHDLDRGLIAGRLEGEALTLENLQQRLQAAAVAMPESPVPAASSVIAPARPAWVARRVHGWTSRLLSPAGRARFEDELLDELHDLAEHNATGRAQLACALRQLGAALQLRRQAGQDRRQVADLGGD